MKTSVFNPDIHIGEQPIRVLKFNIMNMYENTNPSFRAKIQALVEEGKLFTGLNYHIINKGIIEKELIRDQKPFADVDGKIHIHESFLSYVWIICFCVFVLYDEVVVKPIHMQENRPNVSPIDTVLVEQTVELFEYGRSLLGSYSAWDKKYYPNPEEYCEDEAFYIIRTNALFTYAINFILCHEFAHVEKGHVEEINIRNVPNEERKIFEKEADDRSIELILEGRDGSNNKTLECGVLLGLLCLLFFKNNLQGGDCHPDIDHRINNYLNTLNPPENSQLWGLAAVALRLWDEQFRLGFNYPTDSINFKEFFLETFKQVGSN